MCQALFIRCRGCCWYQRPISGGVSNVNHLCWVGADWSIKFIFAQIFCTMFSLIYLSAFESERSDNVLSFVVPLARLGTFTNVLGFLYVTWIFRLGLAPFELNICTSIFVLLVLCSYNLEHGYCVGFDSCAVLARTKLKQCVLLAFAGACLGTFCARHFIKEAGWFEEVFVAFTPSLPT